jgi:glycerophosphoryl diester phosphodiesterase
VVEDHLPVREKMSPLPLIIAHRGASYNAPENTLAGFQMAIDVGAEGVEFDVQLSSDGIPVVIHDTNLERTGLRKEKVADLTARQLAEIDAGFWFNQKYPKRANPDFANETVPTLTRVLELLNGFKGLIYIELKADAATFRELTRSVCDAIRSSPLLPQIIVKSFKLATIPETRCQLPAAKTAALFAPKIMSFLRRRKHIIAIAHEFGADQISLHRSMVTSGLVRRAKEANMPVTIWTVDDPKWIERCIGSGIGAMITNRPAQMLAYRESHLPKRA